MWALETISSLACSTYNEGETKTKLFSLYVIIKKSAYSTLKSKIWLFALHGRILKILSENTQQ